MSFNNEFVGIFLNKLQKSVDLAVELGYIIAHKRKGSDIVECVGWAVRFIPVRT